MRIALLVGVAVVGSASNVDAGKCAGTGLEVSLISPAATTIDQDGGIVVGLDTDPTNNLSGDLHNTGWQYFDGKAHTKPRVIPLAPGLAVLAPNPMRGELQQRLILHDANQKKLVDVAFEFAVYDDRPIGPAPVPTSATLRETMGNRTFDRRVDVGVKAGAPANSVAVIAFEADASGNPKAAISWSRASAGDKSFTIWHVHSCVDSPPGYGYIEKKQKIVLIWVDAAGHLSLPSPPVVVN